MQTDKKGNFLFFGEVAFYKEGNEEEKKEAILYLKLWKKNLLRTLKADLYTYEPHDSIVCPERMKREPYTWYEHWVERGAIYIGPWCEDASIALKFCLKKKLPYELS